MIRRQSAYRQRRSASKTLSEALASAGCNTFAVIVDQHLRAIANGLTTAGIAASVEPITTDRIIERAEVRPEIPSEASPVNESRLAAAPDL